MTLKKKQNNFDKFEKKLSEALRTDVPNDHWLQSKREYAASKGRNRYGAPWMGTPTAWSDSDVKLPVDLLAKLPGMAGEQQNVRPESLRAILKIMKNTNQLPMTDSGKPYVPFINVAFNGEAWVNEGNHRIMAAKKLGWDQLPVEIRYFDGGERIKSGPLYPPKIGLVMTESNKLTPSQDLERDLKRPHSWQAIDHIMKGIAQDRNITPDQLHDQFVKKHGITPDEWIQKRLDEMLTLGFHPMEDEQLEEKRLYIKKLESEPGSKIVKAIRKVVPFAQEIWFHGSRATGQHRKNSDTDILVVVPDSLSVDDYLATVSQLQKLSNSLDNYDIQPTKPGYTIHQIAQEEGKLLWPLQSKKKVGENFADGKNPGRKGLAKRMGVDCKQPVSKLRSIAKKSSGEQQRMAHWCANMKAGRKKSTS